MVDAMRRIGLTTLQHVVRIAEGPRVVVMPVELSVAELLEVRPMLRIGAADESIGQGKLLGLFVVVISGHSMSVARSHGRQNNRVDDVNANLIHD